MKKNMIHISIFIFLTVLLGACGSSDSDSTTNIVKFEGGNFRLYMGYQYKYPETIHDTVTPFVVNLLGDGVSYDQDLSALTGVGSLISFYMYSGNEYEIELGDYTIDIFSTKPPYSADSCVIYYNYDFSQDTGKIYEVSAGTFSVDNLGSVMQYDMSLVSDTLLFQGTFKGPIHTLD